MPPIAYEYIQQQAFTIKFWVSKRPWLSTSVNYLATMDINSISIEAKIECFLKVCQFHNVFILHIKSTSGLLNLKGFHRDMFFMT